MVSYSIQSVSSYAGYVAALIVKMCRSRYRLRPIQLGKESSPSSGVARPGNSRTRTPVVSHGNEDRRGNKILDFMLF